MRAKRMAILMTALVAITCAACDMQDNLIYFPDPARPSAGTLAARGLSLWMVSGSDYRGLIGTAATGEPKGTVIVFHGNAGKAADREFYPRMLDPLGYRVILAEYPGYGGRRGSRSERQFVKDARQTVELAYRKFGGPLYLLGESLGCGVAAAVAASTTVPVEGVVLFTPWDTLLSVAASKAPSFLARLLLKDRYDSVANLRNYAGKTAVIGAQLDEIIPIEHAQALYTSIPGRKRMWTIKAAGHNDWPMFADSERFKEIMDFVAK